MEPTRGSPVRTVIAGRLRVERQAGRRFPPMRLRAVDPATSCHLSEGWCGPGGEFSLTLPLTWEAHACGVELPVRLLVQLPDLPDNPAIPPVSSDVQVRLGETVIVAVDIPAETAGLIHKGEGWAQPGLGLLRADVCSYLRSGAQALVDGGTVSEVLERLFLPLEWAEGLHEDALATLSGEPIAIDRLRMALLSIDVPPESGQESKAPPDDLDFPEVPGGLRIARSEGIALLVAAACWAADNDEEAAAMLDGLAAVLWPGEFLDRLLAGPDAGAGNFPLVMQSLMGTLGPGGGPPPLGPGPGGGLPGIPKIPGRPEIPKVGVKPVIELWPKLKYWFPLKIKPTQRELCLFAIPYHIAKAQAEAPPYEIRTISNPSACKGQVITLTGVNFGPTGEVLFPGIGSPAGKTAQIWEWTDTTIRVKVPSWASPGSIRLSIFVDTLILCDVPYAVYRRGNSLPYFHGGKPIVQSFMLDAESTQLVVEPGATVTATFVTSVGNGVATSLSVVDGPTVWRSFPGTPGGGAHTFTFPVPFAKKPLAMRADVTVSNGCGSSTRSIQLVVAKAPNLRILAMEVTQAIQRLDNTVRLAAHRRTLVRVYFSTDLDYFTYVDDVYSGLGGVTGTLSIWQGPNKLANVPANNAPHTAKFVFFPNARQVLDGSLNFLLPSDLLSGPLRLEVRAEIQPPYPLGLTCDTNNCVTQRSVDVTFEPVRPISIVRVLLIDASRNLPAPGKAEFQAGLLGAISRFPVPDAGWQIRIAPGLEYVTVNQNLSTDDGWDNLLEDMDDIAGDFDDSWDHRWVGLLPREQPNQIFATKGNAQVRVVDRPWPLANDYLTMVVFAGLPEVFAHELGHTFGMDHAGCPMPGQTGAPESIDASLPGNIEEVGIDVWTNAIFDPGQAGDLMSYCNTFGLWPSVVTWQRLLDVVKQ